MGSELVVAGIGVAAAAALLVVLRSFRGSTLRSKFVALGTLKGRTKSEIVGYVGPPTAVTVLPGGRTLLQWQAPGYHIALGFDRDDVCYGVTHEFAAR